MQSPVGGWPLVRLTPADAELIGAKRTVAILSPESAAKQLRNHPELSPDDYALAQQAVDNATHRVQQDAQRLIFIQEVEGATGYVLVVKAVWEKDELFVVSFRRLSNDEAKRDRDVRNLLAKRM